jgi:hypothetical protein
VFTLDPLAALMVVVMSLVLARSTRESSMLNGIIVAAHIALILFVIFAGETHRGGWLGLSRSVCSTTVHCRSFGACWYGFARGRNCELMTA